MTRKRTPIAASPLSGARERSPDVAIWRTRYGDTDLHCIGNRAILSHCCLGLICSVQCPSSVVIKTFDAIRELRDAGIVVAGGFHSPMEKECLGFLLRGKQPVIVCPAKGLGRPRIPAPWRGPLSAGRLLIASPFDTDAKRTTKAQAQTRNEFVAVLADAVLVPHASPGGKAEAVARKVFERGQPLFTFDDDANSGLMRLGACSYNIDEIKRLTMNKPSSPATSP